MRASTRRLFRQVAQLYPCVVISGRAYRDVAGRVGSIGPIRLIGNHGMEWKANDGACERAKRQALEWERELRHALCSWPGIQVENKGPTLAVHYRHSPDRPRAREAILEATQRLRGVRRVGGKAVLNLLPRTGLDKGRALERVQRMLRCERALFIGDDVTDEDAFILGQGEKKDRLIGVRVGRKRGSAAQFFVSAQQEIDRLLRILGEARRG
jgi:trehalose 6-phosphate phosphatase